MTVGHVGPMVGEYLDAGIPFLRSQNIKPFRIDVEGVKFISDEFNRRLKKSALSPGDVVVVRTGYPGTAAVIPHELPVANCADLVVITPGTRIDAFFLSALFNSTWGLSAVSGRLVGSAQQHFNVAAARSLQVHLPPLPTQRKIAAVLSAYHDLIENNNRRTKILEDIAQRIYREWFVEFRYPGYENVPLVDSTLGSVPAAWTVQSFADLGEYVNGYAFKPTDWGESGRPIVKIRELKTGVTSETPRYAANLPGKFDVRDGDLLFSWSADLDAYLWTGGPAWLNQHLFRVDPRPGIQRSWLYHSLRERMPEFRARAQGTTMRHIKRAALTQVTVVKPVPAAMDKFATVVEPIDALVLSLVAATRALREARDLLLPRLISGDIDLDDLHIEVPEVAA
ncbi:MAG: restriction endonuclease subunit S [Candidatus Dormibacter sp.]